MGGHQYPPGSQLVLDPILQKGLDRARRNTLIGLQLVLKLGLILVGLNETLGG